MTTFLLLHGGCHGGWCYEDVARELEARGHRCIAPDMAFEDPALGLADHADDMAALVPAGEDVVVVGHSMGGNIAPLVAARGGVAQIVMLCAVVPEPGLSMADLNARDDYPGPSIVPREILSADELGRSTFTTPQGLHERLYQDCPFEVAKAAHARQTPMAYTIAVQPCPLKAWPDVPTLSIIGKHDGAVGPDWSRAAAARIGAEVIEMDTSHSPFASQPAALADILASLPRK